MTLSLFKRKKLKAGTDTPSSPSLVELFVMFSYDKAEKANIQHTSDISHRIAMCPVVKDGQPCGFYGFARNAAMHHHDCPLLMGQPRLYPTVVSQSEAVALTVANHSGPVPEEVQAKLVPPKRPSPAFG